tara:strand:+ start:1946 stop:2155 length:210 start_codon:yes stop_codon:yes gene_type:complete
VSEKYNVGDFCYFLDINNKIQFCEIKAIYENEKELAYQIQEQTNYRFCTVPHKYCADEEKQLKGRKRNE